MNFRRPNRSGGASFTSGVLAVRGGAPYAGPSRAEPRWSTFLRADPIYFDVLERANGRVVRLGDESRPLLRKGYGTKVGISAFFNTCLDNTIRSARPLARAVRT